MMKIKPQRDGSRSIEIDTPYLRLLATVRSDGCIEAREVVVRDPAPPDYDLAERRLRICETINAGRPCEAMRSVTRVKAGRPIYTVNCKDCGCGGLKAATGRCPRGQW